MHHYADFLKPYSKKGQCSPGDPVPEPFQGNGTRLLQHIMEVKHSHAPALSQGALDHPGRDDDVVINQGGRCLPFHSLYARYHGPTSMGKVQQSFHMTSYFLTIVTVVGGVERNTLYFPAY